MKVIELGKERYNADWLITITEEMAVRLIGGKNTNQVRNAWKQANGKSIRNYSKKSKKTGK